MLSMQAHEVKSQLSDVSDKVEKTLISRLKAIKSMQQFERIQLPKGETIENLCRTGQH